jgi:DNA-directed RNA polymerase specialized sigma24 family protein
MSYPEMPGFQVPGPSKDAAKKVRRYAASLRRRIESLLVSVHPAGLTRDEIAARLGVPPHTIGPRLAELHTATIRIVEQTGERRRGQSGVKMNVWRAIVDWEGE